MTAWTAAMFIGLLVVGLGRDRPARRKNHLVLLVIIGVLAYEALKIHAI